MHKLYERAGIVSVMHTYSNLFLSWLSGK